MACNHCSLVDSLTGCAIKSDIVQGQRANKEAYYQQAALLSRVNTEVLDNEVLELLQDFNESEG